MRRVRRTLSTLAVLAATTAVLVGCIPGPPPLPVPVDDLPLETLEPDGTVRSVVAEEVLLANASHQTELTIGERSAVALAVTTLDGMDPTVLLEGTSVTGETVTIEEDDTGEPNVFAFPLGSRDPVIITVLEAGDYTVTVEEWSRQPTGFQLQMLTSTAEIALGRRFDVPFGPGRPVLALVPEGTREITVSSSSDVIIRVHDPSFERFDEDSASSGPQRRINFGDPTIVPFVVVIAGVDPAESGVASIVAQ